jgi:hypothetical protein
MKGSIFGFVVGLLLLNCAAASMPAMAAPPVKDNSDAGIWDKVLPASQRVTVLDSFNGQAVRDNETGLVWEKALTGGNGIT